LGHRPLVSTQPLKFSDHYVWETYAEVDVRRRNVGSALLPMFKNGELGGGDMRTVGVWSQNRPGVSIPERAIFPDVFMILLSVCRMADN
jgi:long-chain acyl-CoA synthetase